MLLTPHTIVGIALATTIPSTPIAVPLSFAMHFMGDMVPHWDFYTDTTEEQRTKGWRPVAVMADLAIGVGIGTAATLYALWVMHDLSLAVRIFLCGIASVLPDALGAPALFSENVNPLSKLVGKIQTKMQTPAALPWGVISQIAIVIIAFLMILNSIAQ